ncbi:hypothetical protein AB0M48_05660 [Lentzea sp. NPDC051208]|uniref:hypothetical protein n=1 Tax=Lentzea sp. NPDC051208 TaxID=3154642 RepID=UPI0034298019
MYIYGNNTWVDKVEVWLSATHVMPPIIYPADICRSKLDVWGRSNASGHWEQTFTHQGCHTGTQGALFTAEKNQARGSFVCSRTTWDGKAPTPTASRSDCNYQDGEHVRKTRPRTPGSGLKVAARLQSRRPRHRHDLFAHDPHPQRLGPDHLIPLT